MANALLESRSRSGGLQRMKINISSFDVGLNLQVDTAQLQYGAVHRPIRVSEQMLSFSIDWSVQRKKEEEHFMRHILDHHKRSLISPSPMTLHYYGINRTFRGIIDGVQRSAQVTDVLKRKTYRMRLFSATPKVSKVNPLTAVGLPIPTATTVTHGLNNWYDFVPEDQYSPVRRISRGRNTYE